MQTEIISALDFPDVVINKAVELLSNKGIIIFPTDTVYGIGCNIFSEEAASNIFKIKQRSSGNPLTALIASIEDVNDLCINIPDEFYRLAEKYFPGPISIVLQRNKKISPIVTAGLDTIAVRMPDSNIVLDIIRNFGKPLASTSANISGKSSIVSAIEAKVQFYEKIPLIIDGGICKHGIESTVVNLINSELKIIREGVIRKEELVKLFLKNKDM